MTIDIITSAILASAGVLITVVYSSLNYVLSHQMMQKQLFTEFNGRYDSLNNYLIHIEKFYPTLSQLNDAPNSEELKQKVVDYFCLCAEEYYWSVRKGRIDKIMWESWQAGMNYWYNNVPAIKELWQSELASNGGASYYIKEGEEGFFKENQQVAI